MRNSTIEQRLINSLNAFFGNEENMSRNELACATDTSLLRNDPEVVSTEEANTFVEILKMAFMFFPGAFFLYFSSIFFLYAFFVTKMSMLSFGFGLALWGLSAFVTVFGIGKIKDLKCLLIPTSVCAVPFIFFMASFFLPEAMQVKFLFEYSAYLFPIALIAPILTKSLIDKTED